MNDSVEFNSDDVIILPDQVSLIESLVKNLGILRAEARHCILIDSELESNLQWFKEMSNNLQIKLKCLLNLSKQLEVGKQSKIIDFVDKIHQTWDEMNKKTSEEYATFFVASRTIYGMALTALLNEIKKEVTAVKFSFALGESFYDKEYIVKGFMYCNELTKLLNTLERCDEKVQQYLIMSKMIIFLQDIDSMIDTFTKSINLVKTCNSEHSQVFSIVSSLLTGELLAQDFMNPQVILKENTPKKPIFITKNNKRTQLKSLQHLPLFN